MKILGIDPGKTGGLAIAEMYDGKWLINPYVLPVGGRWVDVCALQDFLIYHSPSHTFIEKQQIRGRQSAKGNMTIAGNYHRVLSVLELCGIEYAEVEPKTWQKAILPGITGRENLKLAAVTYAQGTGVHIPTLRPNGKILHDGCADAVCIANYGIRSITLEI